MPRTRAQARGEAAEAKNKFTCFPKLPIEIRFQIWELACQNPRVFGTWAETGHLYRLDRLQIQRFKVPSILHASVEGRTIGLKHYTIEFGTDETSQILINEGSTRDSCLYVNWEVDVFYHSTDSAASLFKRLTQPTRYRAVVEKSYFQRSGSFLFRREYHYLKELHIAVFRGDLSTHAIQEKIKKSLPIEFQMREPAETEQAQFDDDLAVDMLAAERVLEIEIQEYGGFQDEAAEDEAWDKFPDITIGLMEVK